MKSGNAYQIKVTLSDEPPIWRRLEIPGNFTFSDFRTSRIGPSLGNNKSLFSFMAL